VQQEEEEEEAPRSAAGSAVKGEKGKQQAHSNMKYNIELSLYIISVEYCIDHAVSILSS